MKAEPEEPEKKEPVKPYFTVQVHDVAYTQNREKPAEEKKSAGKEDSPKAGKPEKAAKAEKPVEPETPVVIPMFTVEVPKTEQSALKWWLLWAPDETPDMAKR